MMGSPRVSVLMSVYNGARYLRDAVDSILGQTFTDFEFIIVDDGSTDETPAILNSYTDPRIVRLRNETNIGLTRSLNKGLVVARGEYVARQDADDVSLPRRLAKQVEFLDGHPVIGLVGSAYEEFYEDGRLQRAVQMPLQPADIREQLFYGHCFCHGSAMARIRCLHAVGDYDEEYEVAQDRDLWLRLAERFDLANLPEVLYKLRISVGSVTGRLRPRQRKAACRAVQQALERNLLQPSPRTLGRCHWLQALDELADGNITKAQDDLAQAAIENPLLDEDGNWLMQVAVFCAFDITGNGRDLHLGLAFLSDLHSILPHAGRHLHTKHGWAIAELCAGCAFAAQRRGDRREVQRNCLRAWQAGWSQRYNMGLLSIFLRSFGMFGQATAR